MKPDYAKTFAEIRESYMKAGTWDEPLVQGLHRSLELIASSIEEVRAPLPTAAAPQRSSTAAWVLVALLALSLTANTILVLDRPNAEAERVRIADLAATIERTANRANEAAVRAEAATTAAVNTSSQAIAELRSATERFRTSSDRLDAAIRPLLMPASDAQR